MVGSQAMSFFETLRDMVGDCCLGETLVFIYFI